MKTFSSSDVAKALGVGPRTIISAAERGLIPAERGRGTGHHRAYTRDDVVRFALLEHLTALGISRSRAAGLAAGRAGADGILVVTSSGADVHPRSGFNVPLAATIIDLDELRADVDERLANVA
jgi:DNA-binding transcriptional MerR regulator